MVKIIENSKSTKVFKYKLLSQLIREIKRWNGQYSDDIFCRAVFIDQDLPKFNPQISQKSDERIYNNALQKYTQKYLGDDFIIDVNFPPPEEVIGCEMGIWLKKNPKYAPNFLKEYINRPIFRKATELLDELIKEPYDEKIQRDIVFMALGREYDRYPLDEKELSASSFSNEERKHIRIFKVLENLKGAGLIWGFVPRFNFALDRSLTEAWSIKFATTEKLAKAWEEFKKESRKTKELSKHKESEEIPETKTLPDIPDNAKWNSVIIQFINGHDIKIQIAPNFSKKFDYKDMGFEDKRKLLPNKQWELLLDFAKFRGGINWKDKIIHKKQVSELSKKLRKKFGIKDKPIYRNEKNRTYTTKFTIIPEEGNSSERIKFSDKKELDFLMSKSDEEIKKHYKNQEEGYKSI